MSACLCCILLSLFCCEENALRSIQKIEKYNKMLKKKGNRLNSLSYPFSSLLKWGNP